MLLTTERHHVDHEPTSIARPSDTLVTDAPALIETNTRVAVFGHRPAVALGGLAERATVRGQRLVSARDLGGRSWWIPADAVWSDAGHAERPQRPRPIGLAAALSSERALLAGLSDRLGWEAVTVFERGGDLPLADEVQSGGPADTDRLLVFDGRLGHDVPTVVVLGDELTRWGAGSTWPSAVHRALFGDDGGIEQPGELAAVSSMLAGGDLEIVGVDLGTALLRRAGVMRWSVQLVSSDASGRSWDAHPVD